MLHIHKPPRRTQQFLTRVYLQPTDDGGVQLVLQKIDQRISSQNTIAANVLLTINSRGLKLGEIRESLNIEEGTNAVLFPLDGNRRIQIIP